MALQQELPFLQQQLAQRFVRRKSALRVHSPGLLILSCFVSVPDGILQLFSNTQIRLLYFQSRQKAQTWRMLPGGIQTAVLNWNIYDNRQHTAANRTKHSDNDSTGTHSGLTDRKRFIIYVRDSVLDKIFSH